MALGRTDVNTSRIAAVLAITGTLVIFLGCNGGSDIVHLKGPIALAYAQPLNQFVGTPIHFYDDGSYDPSGKKITRFEWDWNNNGLLYEEGRTADHRWNTPGTYRIQFRVTNEIGETDTLEQPLSVTIILSTQDLPPVAAALADPIEQFINLPVHFSDDGSADPDGGPIVAYAWDFDNDGIFEVQGPVADHTWTEPGVYPVQFMVEDDEGNTDTLDTPLAVRIVLQTTENLDPIAIASADPVKQMVGQPVNFTGLSSYDPDGGAIVSYDWDWDNNGTFDESGMNVSHSWDSPGVYLVQFRVTDDEGSTATLASPLQITILTSGWAAVFGGADNDIGFDIAADSMGNVYVAGSFAGSADLDPGPGTVTRASLGQCDIFLTKLDWSGQWLWTDSWGGVGFDRALGVATDSNDNALVTGYFEETVDFDPGAGLKVAASNGGQDAFFCAFDPTSNLVASGTWGSNSALPEAGYSIASDSARDILVSGDFADTADFNPGSGLDLKTSDAAPGALSNFLSRFDSSGSYKSALTWGNHYTYEGYGPGLAVDASDNTWIAGAFQGSVDFDPGPGGAFHDAGDSSYGYLSSFTPAGAFRSTTIWTSDTDGCVGGSAAVCSSGSVYVVGAFMGDADFTVAQSTSHGSYDVCLLKFDTSGVIQWVRTWGGSGKDGGLDAAADSDGNVYVTGFFTDTPDFDPGAGVASFASNGLEDAFLSKFTADGDLLWVRVWGGSGWDNGLGVTVDPAGNVYLTGEFMGTVDFDPGSEIDFRTSQGTRDVFVIKLTPDGLM
jgi:hypothetical protein